MAGIWATAEHLADLKAGKMISNILGSDHARTIAEGDIVDVYKGQDHASWKKDLASVIKARVVAKNSHPKGVEVMLIKI